MAGVVGKTGKYKRTPEMIANYKKAFANKVYTEEGRRKISEARKKAAAQGIHNCLGKHWKLSEKAIEDRKNNPNFGLARIGKKHTPEAREKMRLANLKGRLKQALMKEPTSIEKALYEYLTTKGVVFQKQMPIGSFIVDAYIPSLNLIVEADGTYWHSTPRGIETDMRKNALIAKEGYNLIRLKETEIRDGRFIKIMDQEMYKHTKQLPYN